MYTCGNGLIGSSLKCCPPPNATLYHTPIPHPYTTPTCIKQQGSYSSQGFGSSMKYGSSSACSEVIRLFGSITRNLLSFAKEGIRHRNTPFYCYRFLAPQMCTIQYILLSFSKQTSTQLKLLNVTFLDK